MMQHTTVEVIEEGSEGCAVEMAYRNPFRNIYGTIDLELQHPKWGWIPYTASPDDSAEGCRALCAEIEAKEAESPGHIAPYVGESLEERDLRLWREGAEVSMYQCRAALLLTDMLETVESYLSSDEADALDKLAWATARTVRRMSPTMLGVAALLELTEEELDDLFRFAATIEA